MAHKLAESGILRTTRQVRGMLARGEKVVNLTVGDFDPRYFPIPGKLAEEIQAAVGRGETNYPTPEGMLPLRQAISDYVYRTAGVRYPLDAIVVCSGGRPVLYGAYRAIINPGEAAILALGSVKDAPWVVDGALAVRKVCQLSLSFDHRVVDGQQGSQFLADVGALLADPGLAIAF